MSRPPGLGHDSAGNTRTLPASAQRVDAMIAAPRDQRQKRKFTRALAMHKNTTSPLSGWQWLELPTVRKALDNRAPSRRYARVFTSALPLDRCPYWEDLARNSEAERVIHGAGKWLCKDPLPAARLRERRLVSRKDLVTKPIPRETSLTCIIPRDFPGTISWSCAR
jgi:hypothetical protein